MHTPYLHLLWQWRLAWRAPGTAPVSAAATPGALRQPRAAQPYSAGPGEPEVVPGDCNEGSALLRCTVLATGWPLAVRCRAAAQGVNSEQPQPGQAGRREVRPT